MKSDGPCVQNFLSSFCFLIFMLTPEAPETEITPPKAISIQQNTVGDNVLHFVALPNGKTSIDPVEFPKEPYLEYPYELDEFQKTSVACVHKHESVLVSAHTSAGKTAIALYAIQAAMNQNSRVIYTSPIKALSNQKYRELKETFGEVGLITGDVTVNASAPILVMTTEILRMMLYRGDSVIRELSWVIYDEIHYMKDPERGVVWEESIIMLPDAVRFVFLSATIPNAKEFSEWIASIHNQPCHVVYTDHRPTPLRLYLAQNDHDDPVLIREGEGPLDEDAIHNVYSHIKPSKSETTVFKGVATTKLATDGKKCPSKAEVDKQCTDVVSYLITHDQGPLIVFAFGRKLCDELPSGLSGKTFVTEEESEQISQAFDVAIEKLDESDKALPQIQTLRQLLVRGIGIHHGGLIPLLKELIEFLFQYGQLKVLFATETFAMGLNMPARTVLFHSLNKFDGEKKRLLQGSEFIQMSGRAGRRNNDAYGSVVLLANGDPPEKELVELLKGEAQPLNSEFHVTYHMLLSLLCTRMMPPEQLMKKSFHQFQMEREQPEMEERKKKYYLDAQKIEVPDENRVKKHMKVVELIEQSEKEMKALVNKREYLDSILKMGRVIEVSKFGYGVVAAGFAPKRKDLEIVVAIGGKRNQIGEIVPDLPIRGDSTIYHVRIQPNQITAITDTLIDVHEMTKDGGITYAFSALIKKLSAGKIRNQDWSLVISKEEDRKKYFSIASRIETLKQMLEKEEPIPESSLQLYEKKQGLLDLASQAEKRCLFLKKAVMQQDLVEMRMITEKLGFVDSEGIITDKGRVASVITAGDELVLTELMFDGILKKISSQQIAAIMSVFATDEGTKEEPSIPDEMKETWDELQSIIDRVYQIMIECGRTEDKDKYVAKFDGSYISLTYNWAAGASFSDVMEENPDFFEGGVIRTMKRTEEILRQAQRAASAMGSNELEQKISDAITKIKRDIIFASSLYL